MKTPRIFALLLCTAAVAGSSAPAAADPGTRWGVGLRTTSLGLVSSLRDDSTIAMAGGGLHLRFRLDRHWELELSSVNLSGELAHGALERDAEVATLTTLIHLSPGHFFWDWYLLFGFGTTHDEVTYSRGDDRWASESFDETHIHLGFGIARRFRHLSLGAEMRAVGMGRDDGRLDQPRYRSIDGPVPFESSGTQLDLVATYYF